MDPNRLPEHFHDSADDGENIHRRPQDEPAREDGDDGEEVSPAGA